MEDTQTMRAYHSRQSTGCTTCKKRQVLCDEGHPTCQNCFRSGRACEYDGVYLPAGEMRQQEFRALLPSEEKQLRAGPILTRGNSTMVEAECQYPEMQLPVRQVRKQWSGPLPSEKQQPRTLVPIRQKDTDVASPLKVFHVYRLLSSTAVDPFGTLPLRIAQEAKALLHSYLTYGQRSPAAASTRATIDGVVLSLQDPIAFHSTLLNAGAHYFWCNGSLKSFSDTYLSHKIATLQVVNAALVNPKIWMRGEYVRLIVSLSMIEALWGNKEGLKAHLSGLSTLLSARSEVDSRVWGGDYIDSDEELTERCVIFYIMSIGALHTRAAHAQMDRPMAESGRLMSQFPKGYSVDLAGRLDIFRILPTLLVTSPSENNLQQPVDVSPIITAIRTVTLESDIYFSSGNAKDAWMGVGLIHLMTKLIYIHTLPPVIEEDGRGKVLSSLSGMFAAACLYRDQVLGVFDVNWDPLSRLNPFILGVLMRDLASSRRSIDEGGWDAGHRNLWLWKAFVALASVGAIDSPEGPAMKMLLHTWIREWSYASGIWDWGYAKHILGCVAWPDTHDEIRFEALWKEVIAD